MSRSTYNIMIINNKNEFFNYRVVASDLSNSTVNAAVIYGLDRYIEERLGYTKQFALTKDTWAVVKTAMATDSPIQLYVQLVNGLCNSEKLCIARVFLIDREIFPE